MSSDKVIAVRYSGAQWDADLPSGRVVLGIELNDNDNHGRVVAVVLPIDDAAALASRISSAVDHHHRRSEHPA